MPLRLLLAFALSLALHGGLLIPGLIKRPSAAPPRPALQALLRVPQTPTPPAETLLKNTIDDEEKASPEPKQQPLPPPSPPSQPPEKAKAKPVKTPMPKVSPKQEIEAAQRKLAETQFYPPAAIDRGIEGEVRLIIKLTADGSVADVSLAASSGHPILDNAAIKAAYAMGRLTGATSREIILPVVFRLQ